MTINIQNIEQFLKQIEIVNYKYALLAEKQKFNIFTLLCNGSEEVTLHSRFIAELLNPMGSHGLNDELLKLFIDVIFQNAEESYNTSKLKEARVSVEKYIGAISEDKTTGGRIDIVIENTGDKPIVIENKIYATDQENQLLRYHNAYPDAYIFYLSLDGHEPGDYSLGSISVKYVIQRSYNEHITTWLTRCIEKAAQYPQLRETIVQYQKLINQLTGNTTMADERQELIKLIGQNENAKSAAKIAENWVHVRWHTEYDYWNEFYKITKQEYEMDDRVKCTNGWLDSVIHGKRNKNPWFGLQFPICKFNDQDVMLMIERGWEKCYFGIREPDAIRRAQMAQIISDDQKNGKDDWWVTWRYLEPKINFENFSSNDNTLSLCNPTKRKEIIDMHWAQVKEFVREVKEALKI